MSERDVKEILILTAPDPSDEDISALFESFPDACLILTPALRIAAASETYLRAMMIERDKIIGHSISEVFPDNPAGPAADFIERRASALARADEVELDKDAMLHLITDAAPVLIAYVDADERYRFTNKTYEEWFGRSRADILGKPIVEVLGEPAHATLRPHIEAALAGQSVSYEATIPYKDGGARHTLGTITPHFDGDGTVKGLVVVVSDITERKRVEEALRDSERRYRDIIENARDIVYTHDLAGRFTSLNRVIEQITGYTPEETLAMNIADLIAPEYMEQARRMVAQKSSGGGLTVHDLEIVAKDGRRVTLEINSRPLYHDGVVAGIQGIARDITERKRAE